MFDNYTLNYKMCKEYNELICLQCNNKTIKVEDMTESTKELLTALTYINDGDRIQFKTFENIATMLGYDIMLEGIKDLEKQGVKIIPDYYYRRLVINKNKNKYKGLMR
jgi:hypothetical protein